MTDFSFYKDCYLGTKITDESEFLSYEKKASFYIDKITFGNASDYGDEVKMAVCAVCDKLSESMGVVSENNDGYSVTYKDVTEGDLFKAAVIFLPEELLYRGI